MFINVVTVGMLLLSTAIIIWFLSEPHLTDAYALEDGPIENISAMALFIGAGLMGWSGAMALKKKQMKVGAVSCLLSLCFFIIGMEEISWMQRVLEISSPEFFLEHNLQNETNLHNLNTNKIMTNFYFYGPLFLSIVPFYRNNLSNFLARFKLENLKVFLPSFWFVIPFSVITLFGTDRQFSISILLIWSSLILCYLIWDNYNQKKTIMLFSSIAALVILIAGTYIFRNIPYQIPGIRFWLGSEYKEMLIALGLMIYSFDVYFKPGGVKKMSSARLTEQLNE